MEQTNKQTSGRRETAKHLLLDCREYSKARSTLRLELNPLQLNVPLLVHSEEGTFYTLQFLETTGIATRKWHLERNKEEERLSESLLPLATQRPFEN